MSIQSTVTLTREQAIEQLAQQQVEKNIKRMRYKMLRELKLEFEGLDNRELVAELESYYNNYSIIDL